MAGGRWAQEGRPAMRGSIKRLEALGVRPLQASGGSATCRPFIPRGLGQLFGAGISPFVRVDRDQLAAIGRGLLLLGGLCRGAHGIGCTCMTLRTTRPSRWTGSHAIQMRRFPDVRTLRNGHLA